MRTKRYTCTCGGLILFFETAMKDDRILLIGGCTQCKTPIRIDLERVVADIMEPVVGFSVDDLTKN